MQTIQQFLTHHQTEGFYPFSHMSKKQQIRLQDIKQTQYPISLNQKDRTNLRNPKDQRPPLSSAEVYKISCILPAGKYTLEKLGE